MVRKPRSSRKLLGAFGLALVASLVLSALGVASASAAAPENTVSPVIFPTAPETGKLASTSNGTWTGSPTSYAYQWFRCTNAGAECKSIPGATSSTYAVVAADFGTRLLVSVTATNAEGAGIALKLSAVVTTPSVEHWYSCKNVGAGKGKYEDSACTKEGGSKTFSWSEHKSGEDFGFSASNLSEGGTPFVLAWTIGGSPYEVSCAKQTHEGTLKNSGTAPGFEAGITKFVLSECAVTKPATCTLSSGGGKEIAMTVAVKSTAVAGLGKPTLKFEPAVAGGSIVAGFTLKCGATFIGPAAIYGSFTGAFNNATSSLEFTKANSALTFFGGNPGTIEGTTKMTTTAGELLKIAP